MKRLAWLPLVVVLLFSTVGFTQSNSTASSVTSGITSPPALSDPRPAALVMPGYNAVCKNIGATRVCTSVSDARVTPGTRITVYGMLKRKGVGQAGITMKVAWQSKGTVTCSGVTDENGLASCTAYFPGGNKGHKVRVKVTIGKYKVNTYFTSR